VCERLELDRLPCGLVRVEIDFDAMLGASLVADDEELLDVALDTEGKQLGQGQLVRGARDLGAPCDGRNLGPVALCQAFRPQCLAAATEEVNRELKR